MPHELEYIVNKAVVMCNQGAKPGFFCGTNNPNVKINGCKVCIATDKEPLINIPEFGVCAKTGSPCVPVPTMWTDTYKVKVKGQQTLLYKSKLPCGAGGMVEFVTSGQVPVSEEDLDELMDEHGEDAEDEGWGWWDTAELIPVVGSIIGMVREGAKGNWGMVAANVGFLVLDVAGVVSFGGTTAISTGLKTAGKVATKTVAKFTLKAGAKKAAAKVLTKQGAKALGKSLAKKVDDIKSLTGKLCVFACFTEETLVHTLKGLKQIKDVEIGDDVYSYDEDNDEVTIRKVTSLFSDDVGEILEIETETEIIRTTRTHPFYVNGAYKDAEQIEIGENLFTKSGEASKVISINYVLEETKVYTFEVEEDHCYFVGEEGVLVLNACHIDVFFKAFPHLKGIVGQVHHAIPQKVFEKWPHLFDKKLRDSLANLRGIPKDGMYKLHQGDIHKLWNRFYKVFDKRGVAPTKEQIEKMVKAIDKKFGHLFNPPI